MLSSTSSEAYLQSFLSPTRKVALASAGLAHEQEPSVRAIAEEITVKISTSYPQGSGFIVEKKNNIYKVVTNKHVLSLDSNKQSYQVELYDGKIYPAKVISEIDFRKLDISLVQFESKKKYPIAKISSDLEAAKTKTVYAAGFPVEGEVSNPRGFLFTKGKIERIIKLSFRGGYQIGYTNQVKQGMSGGPLLNYKGEVIAINGRRKYPIWGNPYIFDNGSIATTEEQAKMSKLSWAIPIQTFLNFFK